MGRYRLEIKRSAAREIEAIPNRADRRRVIERIRSLADDPRPPGCRKLSGRNLYRIRQGRYRILYTVEDDLLVLLVVRVRDREEVYRRG